VVTVALQRGHIGIAELLSILAFGGAVSAFAGEAPIGAEALSDLAALPLLRTGTWSAVTDSHDVTGMNDDGFGARFSYLYPKDGEWVLYEAEGPGCVYVIRTIQFKGNLKVYLDGADEPQHVIPFKALYAGTQPPFVAPFVANEEVAHGSSWCYVPIPFAKGCRLTTDEMAPPKFYNILAHEYARGTAVATFDPATSMAAAAKLWNAPQEYIPNVPNAMVSQDTASIGPRRLATVWKVDGGGAVTRLRMRFPGGSPDESAKLVLRAYWDGAATPQIDTPASTFFALGCPRAIRAKKFAVTGAREGKAYKSGVTPPRSLYVGQGEDGWLYCNLPMPFWKGARIDLFNASYHEPVRVECVVEHTDRAYEPAAGYFYAQWREEFPVQYSRDYCVVETRGRGHYIGCVLTFSTLGPKEPGGNEFVRGHLEGDSRWYIDGRRTPLVVGTGTEEYFNWGWYDLIKHDATFTYPTHGYALHRIDDQDHTVMYRFHVGEVAPYSRSFRFELEHGPIGRWPAHYSGTAFYYQRPEVGLTLTDELDVGNRASEAAHGYECDGVVAEPVTLMPYEGDSQLPPAEDSPRDRAHVYRDEGRVWTKASAFTVAIAPDNAGVKLRRRSDYSIGATGDLSPGRKAPAFTPAQRVAVSVNGKAVGGWYLPQRHARETWLDSEFEIPASFTHGRDRIRITLTAKDDTRWDAYTYWVYSYAAAPK
jgi:hypothetical protein